MLQMIEKRKKFNLSKRNIILLSIGGIFLFVVLISGLLFNIYLNRPAGKDSKQIAFTVENGSGVREISKNLEEKGLIKNDLLFMVYLKINGLVGSIRAGDYLIAKTNSPVQVADILTNGKVASLKITIPEGWTNNQIGDYLEKQNIVKKSDFIAATKERYSYDFLKDAPSDFNLEGFLFPDTYQISYNSKAKDIVKKMLDNFDKKLTPEIRNQISVSGYNVYETITLASVVEREVSKPEDRNIVAGIFLKRLENDMPLQSDVTVIYALNTNKKELSLEDISVDSPYNTYKYKGLPYGPISNPGLESIQAVLNPQPTDYFYFLAANGTTYYAKNLNEQEINKQKYLK